ncbi:TetR/AcrR family transcriptional regulator [Rhodococcus sp. D2-41]|uniref:TetR/AcrR family transcriptional regulator n=1 Tax=Speluncibacter jeojiensis TaxID=2710754 RepID=A0A9X4M2D5_9ACTN|nr:TetR/AcrR family transcriptional regulator [Rhodococcus sp. D2-41]MDG3009060.1 TetR/AcrR family transcriptional regulator [Rhodococcus sp. D2-41]MDG3015572.1 TetR/AcrR family transcriptional regulator [Corynebacteriales bacterium D3-21]
MTGAGGQHRLGPQRNAAIDTAVLDATRELLIERGYSGTSIDAIARRAGVGRPAIYRRWPSKAHIVHDAIYPRLTRPEGSGGDVEEDIALLAAGAVELFGSPATRAAVPGLMSETRGDPELHDLLVDQPLAGVRDELRRRLDEAIADGRVRSGIDSDTLLDVIAGTAIFALSVRDVDDQHRLAESLADLLLHGVLAD